ncbi:hypothetical protein [Flavobacterium sp. 1355]|uniref:hypothetical protein n=1 Tax=Flavobacterium sp. 1355 TaxID=2806571 RepID=UPI001AEA548E|nr:hypothetical protein [Flavobacterium sp. 1355]MBP1224829.1 hypothetical protein [Flavobacterium sp. 1355]
MNKLLFNPKTNTMKKTTYEAFTAPFTPPGTDITPEKAADPIGHVVFKQRKSVEILSPYVEAYYNANENRLSLNAIVYVTSKVIAANNGMLDYSVLQNTYIDLDGHAQLQFFIVYDMPEELSGDLSIYEIVFDANSDIFIGGLSNLKTIQTFLWDKDPETSRGTETPVRSI